MRSLVLALALGCAWMASAAADGGVGLLRFTVPGPPLGQAAGPPLVGLATYPAVVGRGSTRVGPVTLAAVADAAPTSGRFPLVIISHGTGGLPELHGWLFEALARRGFVVAGVAHPGNSRGDNDGAFGDALLVGRSEQFGALIDGLLAHQVLGPQLDARRIGLIGHSAGGYGGLLAAGAQPDFGAFAGACRRADRPGAAVPRLRALVALAPALGCLFTAEGLRGVGLPVLLVQADADEVLQRDYNAAALVPLLPRPPELRRLPDAGHFVFLNVCDTLLRLLAASICTDPPGVDRAMLHGALADQIAGFLRASLADD